MNDTTRNSATAYKVHDGKRGHVFSTLAEAAAYAREIQHRTGVFVAVTETRRAATHVYTLAE